MKEKEGEDNEKYHGGSLKVSFHKMSVSSSVASSMVLQRLLVEEAIANCCFALHQAKQGSSQDFPETTKIAHQILSFSHEQLLKNNIDICIQEYPVLLLNVVPTS